MNRYQAILAGALPLTALLGVGLFFDYHAGVSINRLFLAAVGGLGAIIVVTAWLWSRRWECLVPLAPFAALLILLARVDWSPVKPFVRFFHAVEPGMREAEVLQALDEEFPPAGRYRRPWVNRLVGPAHLGFILDRSDGRYDAEIVSLEIAAGRVVGKRYMPD